MPDVRPCGKYVVARSAERCRMRDEMSSEGRGIDVMVYYRTKGLEEDQWERDGDRIDAACRTPAQDAEGRRRGGELDGGNKLKKAEKKEDKSKGITQSRIGRRSCKLRDRTQNDVGAPPGSGTTHRRQSKCTCEHVRTVVVELAAGVRAKTTMMMRRMNESSTVSILSMTFGRLKPVGNRAKVTWEESSAQQSMSIKHDREPNTKRD